MASLSRSGSMNKGQNSPSASSSYTTSAPITPASPASPGKSQAARSMKFQSTRSPLAQAGFGPDMDTVYEDAHADDVHVAEGHSPNPFADESQLPRYSTITKSPTSTMRLNRPDTLTTMNNSASLYKSRGRYEEAGKTLREVLSAQEESIGIVTTLPR